MADIPIVDYNKTSESETWNQTILLSRTFFARALKSDNIRNLEWKSHRRYGFVFYGFWGGVLILGIISNFFSAVINDERLNSYLNDLENNAPAMLSQSISKGASPLSRLCHFFRTNFTIPVVIGHNHRQSIFWCTIPTRIEAIVIFSYVALSVALCSINYHAFDGNL
ncbi:MAG: hypothetical protein M1834_001102 [Cirrosporium novae-zelandiae]|nr:MAG: hypothetical protein M1834_001102 [Cirrosporium novae-zelandiae]